MKRKIVFLKALSSACIVSVARLLSNYPKASAFIQLAISLCVFILYNNNIISSLHMLLNFDPRLPDIHTCACIHTTCYVDSKVAQ